jgi:YesN/AraC family two-component response regulator
MYKVVNGKKLILPSAAETKAAMNNRMGFSASPKCDYHIQEELDMLHVRFPGIQELTLDDYADYFGIDRHYASQHF